MRALPNTITEYPGPVPDFEGFAPAGSTVKVTLQGGTLNRARSAARRLMREVFTPTTVVGILVDSPNQYEFTLEFTLDYTTSIHKIRLAVEAISAEFEVIA